MEPRNLRSIILQRAPRPTFDDDDDDDDDDEQINTR